MPKYIVRLPHLNKKTRKRRKRGGMRKTQKNLSPTQAELQSLEQKWENQKHENKQTKKRHIFSKGFKNFFKAAKRKLSAPARKLSEVRGRKKELEKATRAGENVMLELMACKQAASKEKRSELIQLQKQINEGCLNNKRSLLCNIWQHQALRLLLNEVLVDDELPFQLKRLLNEFVFSNNGILSQIKPFISFLSPQAAQESGLPIHWYTKFVQSAIQSIVQRWGLDLDEIVPRLWNEIRHIERKFSMGEPVKFTDFYNLLHQLLQIILLAKEIINYIKEHRNDFSAINRIIAHYVIPAWEDIQQQIYCLLSPFGIKLNLFETENIKCPPEKIAAIERSLLSLNNAIDKHKELSLKHINTNLQQAKEKSLQAKTTNSLSNNILSAKITATALFQILDSLERLPKDKQKKGLQAAQDINQAITDTLWSSLESHRHNVYEDWVEDQENIRPAAAKLQRRWREKQTRKKWKKLTKQVKKQKGEEDLLKYKQYLGATGHYGSMPGFEHRPQLPAQEPMNGGKRTRRRY